MKICDTNAELSNFLTVRVMKKLFLLLLTLACLTGCYETSQTVLTDGKANRAVTNFSQLIEGNEAGVLFNSASGAPDASPSILIRGINSINASTEPLYIVDGMRYNGPLNMLNPNDIESVKILKNPDEISIYGIQGANGVVVIKTKKGGAKR